MKKLICSMLIVAFLLVIPLASARYITQDNGSDLIAFAANMTTVGFDNAQLNISVGASFTLRVMVYNVQNVYGWQWWLNYPSNLQCLSVVGGTYDFGFTGLCVSPSAWGYSTMFGRSNGVSGTGSLSILTFKAVSGGSFALQLTKVKLISAFRDPNGWPLPISFAQTDCAVTIA